MTLFERAIALDPAFARAHAGLSFTRFQDAFVNYTHIKRAAADARRLAERSVDLDPLNPFLYGVRAVQAMIALSLGGYGRSDRSR
jgi:hypothetical protein